MLDIFTNDNFYILTHNFVVYNVMAPHFLVDSLYQFGLHPSISLLLLKK